MSKPSIQNYEILEKLGNGSYSTVYKGHKKCSKDYVAIKCVEKSILSKSAEDNLITEIRLLKNLNHKHIVEMKEFLWDDKTIYIVMEYCNAGDLSSFIKKHSALPETTCKIFLRQLAQALMYMRSNDVSHFDLKPQNLLLTRSPYVTLKVADFGFAQHIKIGEENKTIKGSPLYMAPEILLKNRYDAKADLWSIGVILYECLFGKAPYSSKTLQELLEKIKRKQKIDIPKNAKISPECEDLLSRLLNHCPEKRISFEDFFNHDFLDLKHAPSDDNLNKAIELVNKAIENDTKQNYTEAYYQYCEALQFFVPIISIESDAGKKLALRQKVHSYMQRAEEIKQHSLSPTSQNVVKTQIQAALTPHLNYQQLISQSSSSPNIENALQIGRQGELYVYEKQFKKGLENLKTALGLLVPLLQNEPKGQRRDLLHLQVMHWMKEAESMQSLLSVKKMESDESSGLLEISNQHCCLQ